MTARPLPAPSAISTAAFAAGLVVGLAAVAGYSVGGLLAVAAAAIAATGAILVLLFGAERVLVGAILLNLPLQLDVYLGYRTDEAALGALGGLPISITTVSLVLLVLRSALVADPAGSPAAVLATTRSWLPLGLFVGLAGLSVVTAADLVLAIYGLVLLVQSFLLYVYLSATLRTDVGVRWAVDLLLVGLLLEAGVMVLQRAGLQIAGPLGSEVWQSQVGRDVISRVSGTLGSPNGAAAYLSVVLLIALAVVLSQADGWRRWLATTALVTGGAALALTLSRGGMISFAVGAATLVGLATRRRLLRTGPWLVVVMATGLLAAAFGNELLLRVTADPGQGNGRLPLIGIAVGMVASAPVTGVGVNNFAAALPDFLTPQFSLAWLYVVHNYYLQVAAEIGLPGLAAFGAFLLSVMRSAWVASRTLPDGAALLALGVLAALIARVVHMNLDVFGEPLAWESLTILAALATALLRQSRTVRPALDAGRMEQRVERAEGSR